MKKYSRKHIGSKYVTSEGYELEIINGGSKNLYCTIKINDWISEANVSSVKMGYVKYPLHRSVYGAGFIGIGSHSKSNDKEAYTKWQNMLMRCYSSKYQSKNPTYVGTIVCPEWDNFQTFAKWYYRFYPKSCGKYELDKDLKSVESKVYSPTTCLFIPHKLNSFMTNIQTNTSGCPGVTWHKANKKWRARVTIKGKNKHLGLFIDIAEASKVYQTARAKEVKRWQRYYSFDYPKAVLDKLK